MFGWISYSTVPILSGVATEPLVSIPVAWSFVLTTLAASCGLIWLLQRLAEPRRRVGPEARSEKRAA